MLKRQAEGTQSKKVIDLKTIFLPLLLIRQQGKKELGFLFAYKLLALCPAFIDGQGCLRESIDYKLGLVKSPDILDTSWPHGGKHYDLVAPIEECFNNYTDATRKIIRRRLCQRQ